MAALKTKRIVCLAKSYIRGGRCIAGKELLHGGRAGAWIRPVSSPENGGVSYGSLRYRDGTIVRVRDVADVPLLNPQPKDYQQENWLLDTSLRWDKVRRCSWEDLEHFIDPTAPLWTNGYSSPNRTNDQIPVSDTSGLGDSLRFLKVHRLDLIVSEYGGRRRVDARFQHDDTEYCLPVTDPDYADAYRRKADGAYRIYGCYLTVSLALPPSDSPNAYKLIAAIFDYDMG